ncbi:recombinase family protein [Actinophytocola sp.]|uniref:recombinase family protein n=1 Tax=Actinophytocola sp. TaxID=1872138 RepID=UPI003899A7B9
MRFAFYGRMSTEDFQDYVTSRAWQRNAADELVTGKGVVVVEFFDRGCSRRVGWSDRPEAGVLLAALADPDRGFDAVVVGEYERAFFGDQLTALLPVFARHGVQLWLPETNGPVDAADPVHRALTMLLGAQSKREVLRSRFRVLAAMRAQVVEQGRFLGGRPPYGYRLVDAGPHPNAAHARWGRRLQRLEPDPVTARHVRWMFAQRLAGHSASRIAHDLNVRGVPCPSSADPGRNRHRSGAVWTLRTVATILGNPRYTGRQVWNRQCTDHDSTSSRKRAGQRWNQPRDWVISKAVAHPALVSEADFIAAQAVDASPRPADGGARRYALVGLVVCRVCGRRMDSHWVHGRPGYRCRHGHTTAKLNASDRPKTLYLRQDRILARIAVNLAVSEPLEPAALADSLRTQGLTILCDADTCTRVNTSSTGQPQLQLIN